LLDREVLDLLRSDPELLAVADAIASTQGEDSVPLSTVAPRRWLRGSITGRVRHAGARRRRGG
jgi:hypothetical protein